MIKQVYASYPTDIGDAYTLVRLRAGRSNQHIHPLIVLICQDRRRSGEPATGGCALPKGSAFAHLGPVSRRPF
jgi:hypothetical protein